MERELLELYECFKKESENTWEGATIALMCVAQRMGVLIASIDRLADKLGTNNANTNMGAMELIAKEIRDGFSYIGRDK